MLKLGNIAHTKKSTNKQVNVSLISNETIFPNRRNTDIYYFHIYLCLALCQSLSLSFALQPPIFALFVNNVAQLIQVLIYICVMINSD